MADHQQKARAVPAALNLSVSLRKPNPSPLQLSTIPTPLTDRFSVSSSQEVDSNYNTVPQSPRLAQSPRSPAELSKSSGEEVLLSSSQAEDARSNILATPRVALASPQHRAVSGPAYTTSNTDRPSAQRDLVPTKTRADVRPTERLALRTSSIDSTMSTNSSTSGSALQDPLSPNPLEIQQLIASAGSSEALIRSLIKEKQTAAQQNAQLWRLINKQRHLIMGLNSDLAKAAEDRERYQRQYKEMIVTTRIPPTQHVQSLRRNSASMNPSPSRSEDDLPIQRHNILPTPKIEHRRSASVGAEAKTNLKEAPNATFGPESIASSSNTSPSFSSEGKPRTTPDSEGSDEGLDSRRNTIVMSNFKPISPIAPLEIKKVVPALTKVQIPSTPPSKPPPNPRETATSPSSFSARRSMAGKLGLNSPVIPTSEGDAISSPLRKGPPARLNLQPKIEPPKIIHPMKSPADFDSEDHSDSDYDVEIDEIPAFERGRKKTREEDDREREYMIAKQEESRSKSKQEKQPKSGSKPGSKAATPLATPDILTTIARSPAIHAFSPDGSPAMPTSFSPHASLDGMLSARSPGEQSVSLSAPPISPGLPRSPRPGDRPQNAPLPRAPHESHVLSPPLSLHRSYVPPSALSPSLQKQSFQPTMPQTPVLVSSPKLEKSDTASTTSSQRSPALRSPGFPPLQPTASVESPRIRSPKLTQESPKSPKESPKSPVKASVQETIKSPIKDTFRSQNADTLQRMPSDNSSLTSMTGGIYRGLISEAYPDLLLPPNALPSISVKVTSSRLRPSRNSVLSLKSVEEEPVFILGVTARSNAKQLWRVEKPILSLPQLDQQLKQASAFDVRLPDRNLFAGHAPSKIDARREALERYFEEILDTPMNEKAGLILCQFLSVQVIPTEEFDGIVRPGTASDGQHPTHMGPDGKIVKEGFLTKRGKNFGGWKARYFVLDDPTLRYYESPGGSLLGQIKLSNAQIGRQSAQSSAAAHSPSRAGDDNEKEFRHAFLILEPKKKDSNSMIRHVLCAENDTERDEWVEALLQYIGHSSPDAKPKTPRQILTFMKNKDDSSIGSSSREDLDTIQSVSYENTVEGQPVRSGPPLQNPSSPSVAFHHNIPMLAGSGNKAISGPTGGAVIQDATAWGNKAPDSPRARDKDKKRSLWGFRDKSDHQSTPTALPPPRPTLPVGSRAIFGMSLAEAVEMYPAKGTEINLPSVVYRCFEYLEAKAAYNEEGIFRLSGSNLTIKALRDRFNQEGDVDFLAEGTYYDVHAVASLLKMYLRELPGSVLGPRELHRQFQSVVDLEDRDSKIAAYNVLVHRLPPANWTLIRSLSAFLIGIVNNCNINKMTVRNVGIVFSPTLNIPSPLFAAFMTDFDKIFTQEPPPAAALSPVMEDPDPTTYHQKHVLHDSRPPQSRDASVQRRRSRSRTRSRTPDNSVPSQAQLSNYGGRPSAEEFNRQTPDLQYPTQHSRRSSREDSRGPSPMSRQRSEDSGNTNGLVPPSQIKSKRDSIAPGLAATNIMRDAKARRRESSMLMMGGLEGMGAGQQRKSSFPQLRNAVGMDES